MYFIQLNQFPNKQYAHLNGNISILNENVLQDSHFFRETLLSGRNMRIS